MSDGGGTRVNTVAGGGSVCETIVEVGVRRYVFRIDSGPLPLHSFVSTLEARDDGAEGCVLEWSATFEPSGVSQAEAAEIVCGFFQAGVDAVAITLAQAEA